MDPTFAAPDDARERAWLELAEAHAWADMYRAAAERRDDPAAPIVGELRDGLPALALGAIDSAFFDRIVGLGDGTPATEAGIDEAIAFFDRHGRQHVLITQSPFAGPPALGGWIESRGFRRTTRWAKTWRDTDEVPDVPTDLRIEAIGPDRASDFADITLTALELPPIIRGIVEGVVGRPGWTTYLGFDGDQPVSAAAMWVGDGIGWLGFGSTLETACGRGGQSAMFARRIADARDQGCRIVVSETGEDTPDEPNPSYRNMLRLGFRLAYLRPNWVRG